MTFDQLLKKHEDAVDAAVSESLNSTETTKLKTLELLLVKDLRAEMPHVGPENLAKAVTMAAKELMSLKLYPPGTGPAGEGELGGVSASDMNPDIMDDFGEAPQSVSVVTNGRMAVVAPLGKK